MIYGYARVSTRGQMADGNSLDAQATMLAEQGAVEIYRDAYTGKKFDRPALLKLLDALKDGDTLVITKLDRIARSLSQGVELINHLINKGVRVHILNIGIMDNTPSSKLIRNIFLSFAEFEAAMIVERTREGKEIAKQKDGYTEGRPKKYNSKQIEYALELLVDHSYKQVAELTSISKSTLIRALKQQKREEKE